MFNHRRKIAAAIALILALGSAAASAANFVNGNGMRPSFGGASDALEMAMSGAGKATQWMITRSRNSVDKALAFINPPSVRPPEVPYLPESPPMVRRGPLKPLTIEPGRPYGVAFSSGLPDQSRPGPSFEEQLRSLPNQAGLLSVDASASLPGLSSGGGGSTARVSDADIVLPTPGAGGATDPIMPAVPEPESYVMLLAGLGLLGMIARRRGKSAAV